MIAKSINNISLTKLLFVKSRSMKKTRLVAAGVLLGSLSLMAQDPLFVQPSGGNINLNPALVGNDSVARLGLICRNQWPALSGNYVTTGVNFYQFIPKLNAYAGINYLNDNQTNGTLISNNFSVFYSQNINFKKVLFRPSVEVVYGNKKLDYTKLNFGDMIDARRGFVYDFGTPMPVNANKAYLDLSIGSVIYYKNILLGFSAHHINQPDVGLEGSSKLPIRYGIQLGYSFAIKKTVFSPFAYFIQQQNFQSLIVGANVLLFNHLNVALSYKNSSSIISNVGYQNKWFKINYSFDIGLSHLFPNNAGSHELGLSFRFWKVKPKHPFIRVNSIYS